jgi:hypothetical protein
LSTASVLIRDYHKPGSQGIIYVFVIASVTEMPDITSQIALSHFISREFDGIHQMQVYYATFSGMVVRINEGGVPLPLWVPISAVKICSSA